MDGKKLLGAVEILESRPSQSKKCSPNAFSIPNLPLFLSYTLYRIAEDTSLLLNYLRLPLIFQVPENSPVDSVVGNLSVYDPDNLHVPLQKFNCVVVSGGPFKVSDLVYHIDN